MRSAVSRSNMLFQSEMAGSTKSPACPVVARLTTAKPSLASLLMLRHTISSRRRSDLNHQLARRLHEGGKESQTQEALKRYKR